jgi:hypothetical protein
LLPLPDPEFDPEFDPDFDPEAVELPLASLVVEAVVDRLPPDVCGEAVEDGSPPFVLEGPLDAVSAGEC